jgi:hypothetical protein
MPYRELLIGCGAKREKCAGLPTAEELRLHANHIPHTGRNGLAFQNLTTLDNNPDHKPDILCDLCTLGQTRVLDSWDQHITGAPLRWWMPDTLLSGVQKVPDDSFDEIHAYEVLEHIGAQGDYKAFFAQFTEFHRILKPGGLFFATCPSFVSMWAWGDPSHTRVLTSGTLSFLSQAEYAKQVGVTPMSDFRYLYKADFVPRFVHEDQESLRFVLEAIK